MVLAVGMTAIAVPLGSALAFLMIRTDLPGRRWLEPVIIIPVFVSPMVLGFGYIVALGPVGFVTLWWQRVIGPAPWDIYSLTSLVVIAGLTHVPAVYLYTSSALRSLASDLEEAARSTGAGWVRVATTISLPMVWPAILYSGVLVLFLGFELFGLPLVLGDPQGLLVLATYLYKLTNKLGVPSYQLMAVVAVVIIAIAFPLVLAAAPAHGGIEPVRERPRQGARRATAAARALALGGGRAGARLARPHHRHPGRGSRAPLRRLELGRGGRAPGGPHPGPLPGALRLPGASPARS